MKWLEKLASLFAQRNQQCLCGKTLAADWVSIEDAAYDRQGTLVVHSRHTCHDIYTDNSNEMRSYWSTSRKA